MNAPSDPPRPDDSAGGLYERIAIALAPRWTGGLSGVLSLGAPLGPQSVIRWREAGLLGPMEAQALGRAPADLSLEALRTVLQGAVSASLGDWNLSDAEEGTLPEGRADRLLRRHTGAEPMLALANDADVALAADAPAGDSWSWDGAQSAFERSFDTVANTALPAPGQGGPRFALGEAQSQGRFFDVLAARDRLLGRDVLAHRMSASGPLDRRGFIAAVRRQARLQHPNIQPIYELDVDAEGTPFYVTALVRDRTLAALIKAMGAGNADMPPDRLIEMVADVAHALALAHRRGTLHRDVRPGHVRLGRFGEVQLGGWFRSRRTLEPPDQGVHLNPVDHGLGFLAPERLEGGLAACTEAADVWGLGAMLYGVLARRPPVAGRSSAEVLEALKRGALVPPSARAEVDPNLDALCQSILQVDPAARPDAASVAAALLDYLEGTQARARRTEVVDEHVQRAREAQEQHAAARARLRVAFDTAQAARDPADPQRATGLRERLPPLRLDVTRWFVQAETEYEAALTALPNHEQARLGLSLLYHRARDDAARGRVPWDASVVDARLGALDPQASGREPGIASLEIRTQPQGLWVTLHTLSHEAGVWRTAAGERLGLTPLVGLSRPAGPALLVFVDAQGERARMPVRLSAEHPLRLDLDLPLPPRGGQVSGRPELLLVAGGPARVGAGVDGDSGHALPESMVEVPGCFLSRTPVTFGQYQVFLNAVHAQDAALAARHAPRAYAGAGPIWMPGPTGYTLPIATPEGRPLTADHPVFGLELANVEAWLQWRRQADNLPWRLPSEVEWEKAARGIDGRRFPWGDAREPSACNHLNGRPETRPVGSHAGDRSVYGVLDLAGCVREYTMGIHGQAILKGGSWLLPFECCEVSHRNAPGPTLPLATMGFRVALDAHHTGPEARAERPRLVLKPLPIPAEPTEPEPFEPEDATAIGLLDEDLTVEGRTVFARRADIARPPSRPDAPPEVFAQGPTRYLIREELARGSMGRVLLAFDERLERPVALKVLHEKHADELLARYRFAMEARITGRLQHPNVVPVYDVGVLPSGERFFTMKPIEGVSLGDVLRGTAAGDRRMASVHPRDRLLTVLRKVCQGIGFAHAHSVVHRDLKPANILIGDLGEVAIVDLGLARQIDADPSDHTDVPEAVSLSQGGGRITRAGSVIGTPYYMSPEQAMGLQDLVGPPADIYGLGALLYHVLALRPPFGGRTVSEVLGKVRRGNPMPPSRAAPDQDVPESLDALVLRALSMEPGTRPATAQAMAEEIAVWQQQARLQAADAGLLAERAVRATEAWHAWERTRTAEENARAQVNARRTELRDAVGPVRRAALRSATAHLDTAREASEHALAHLVRRSRLAMSPDRPEVQARLMRALHSVWSQIERDQDLSREPWYRRQLETFDADGATGRWLRRGAALNVRTQPAGMAARVELCPERTAEPEVVYRGPSPLELLDLAPGNGSVLLRDPQSPQGQGHLVRVPFVVRRDRPQAIEVNWPQDGRSDHLVVPAGRFLYGGDAVHDDGAPPRPARLQSFRISRYPVTSGEYAAWLAALEEHDPQAAAMRAPRLGPVGPLLWSPMGEALVGAFDPLRPVTGITLADAHAYACWRAETEGLRYRLPTSAEWEKAARGVDGRLWPWGNEPGMSATIWRGPLPAVGHEPSDVSPYGMRDAATGVFEWTLTAARDDASACYLRGGCRAIPLPGPACVRRQTSDPAMPSPFTGFRLVVAES